MYGGTNLDKTFSIKTLYTAFDEWVSSDYFFSGECHNFWELVIVADGEVGVTAGENAWVLKQGQAVVHPPMEFHRIWYGGNPGRIIVLSFGAEHLLPEWGGRFSVPDMTVPEALLRQTRACFHMDGIRVAGVSQPERAAQMLVKRWELFILELFGRREYSSCEVKLRTARNYAAIVQVLESHIHENLTVPQIARLCSMSPICLQQTFSKYAGLGVMKYFKRLKIEQAIRMLQNGSSVQETADALGFSTQNYFSATFKRITGKTPTSYK